MAATMAVVAGLCSRAQAPQTYLLLDSRNVQDGGGARLVLGPVGKPDGERPLLTETEPWELRFDNMQPNVFHDGEAGRWRAWYSSFSSCGGKWANHTGPGLYHRLHERPTLNVPLRSVHGECEHRRDLRALPARRFHHRRWS